MSIAEIKTKIKSFSLESIHQIYVVFLIILTAGTAFSLGRLSVDPYEYAATILYPEEVLVRAEQSLDKNREVVASKKGSRYYFLWCEGVEDLSEVNKIFFETPQLAEDAGYTIAKNCDMQ